MDIAAAEDREIMLYCLSGDGQIGMLGATFRLQARSAAHIPSMSRACLLNDGQTPLKCIVFKAAVCAELRKSTPSSTPHGTAETHVVADVRTIRADTINALPVRVIFPRESALCCELFYEAFPVGQESHHNAHPDLEQVYFVISGKGDITVGEETEDITGNEAVFIPQHILHYVKNTARYPLEYICLSVTINGWPDGHKTWQEHCSYEISRFGE